MLNNYKNVKKYLELRRKKANYTNESQISKEASLVISDTGLSSREHSLIIEEIANATGSTKFKRVNYKEGDKLMIAKYANMHGPARATAKYVKQFPKLSESTVRGWVAKYRKELSDTENNQFTINDSVIAPIAIGQKRGRPLSLSTELDAKLRRFIICLREAGGNINRRVIHGVLMGLIKSDLSRAFPCLITKVIGVT